MNVYKLTSKTQRFQLSILTVSLKMIFVIILDIFIKLLRYEENSNKLCDILTTEMCLDSKQVPALAITPPLPGPFQDIYCPTL